MKLKVQVSDPPDRETESIEYEERDDGWYVHTENVDGQQGFRRYAISDARAEDVRQLLRKDYSALY